MQKFYMISFIVFAEYYRYQEKNSRKKQISSPMMSSPCFLYAYTMALQIRAIDQ